MTTRTGSERKAETISALPAGTRVVRGAER